MIHARLVIVLTIALLLSPLAASAATWCVPSASIRPSCPNVAPTLQAAVDLALAGGVIYVGPGIAPARTAITKRLSVKCLDGAVLTDTGLAASATLPVLRLVGDRPRVENCRIEVRRSAGGIFIEPSAAWAQMKGLEIIGLATPKAAYGVRSADNPRLFFIGGLRRPTISGFVTGFDSRGCGWLDIEAGAQGGVLFEGNTVGVRSIHDKGQVFFNEFRENGTGLEIRGNFHQDVNANRFIDNGLGLLWGLAPTANPASGCTAQKTMEFNHAVFDGNGTALLVETAPGIYSQDYHDDPGIFVQWTDMTIDGVLYPNHNTRGGPCP